MSKILMIGPSQTGKSCIITASSMSLKSIALPNDKVLSFSLTDYNTQLKVNDSIKRLMDKEWPDSTASLSEYKYNVRVGSEVIASDLTLVDSAGGWWQQQGRVAQEGRDKLLGEVNSRDCVGLLFIIPADMVKSAIENADAMMQLMVYQDILEAIRNNTHMALPKIGMVLSKLDTVEQQDVSMLVAFLKHQLPAFFSTNSGISLDIMTAQLGYNLANDGDNHVQGTLDLRARNHCAPFLFALKCVLENKLESATLVKHEYERRMSRYSNELDRRREANWLDSWWNYNSEEFYTENIKCARRNIEEASSVSQTTDMHLQMISGMLAPLMLMRVENGVNV